MTKRLTKAAAGWNGADGKSARRRAAAAAVAGLANASAAASAGPSTSAASPPPRLLKLIGGEGRVPATVILRKAGRRMAKERKGGGDAAPGRVAPAPPPPATPAAAGAAGAPPAAAPPPTTAGTKHKRAPRKGKSAPTTPPPPPDPATTARAASLAAALPSPARALVAAVADAALAPAPPGPNGLGADSLPSWRAASANPNLVRGRFSAEEKDTLVAAVHAFAAAKSLPTGGGWAWLFATRAKGPARASTAGAWKVIASALPHRSPKAVCAAGTRLLHPGNHQGAWSGGETARLLALVDQKGPRWAEIGGALGRLPEGCRDRWKEARLGSGRASGRWSAAEEAALSAAVTADLQAKASAGGGGTHSAPPSSALPSLSSVIPVDDGQALDRVGWGAVSSRVGTRSPLQCMAKWYEQLAPTLASRGEWGGKDDDAALLRAVMLCGRDGGPADWGRTVPGRSGAAAAARWRSVRKLVPGHGDLGAPAVAVALAWEWMPDLLDEVGGAGGGGGTAPPTKRRRGGG